MNTQKTFSDLRKINVSDHIEKKGNLSYLSWTHAVDTLLQNDPLATWEFKEPKQFGQTMMVFCEVTALGKTMKMHLPVMDNRNQAVVNPNARQISDAMMRCLVKCIACFGIGLYIYAGEDLPSDYEAPTEEEHAHAKQVLGYRFPFGSFKFMAPKEALEKLGPDALQNALRLIEGKLSKGEVYKGVTFAQMQEAVREIERVLGEFENQDLDGTQYFEKGMPVDE